MYLVVFKTLTNEIVSTKKFRTLKKAQQYAELVVLKSLTIFDFRIVLEKIMVIK